MGPVIDAYRAGASATLRSPPYVLLVFAASVATVPPLLLVPVVTVPGVIAGSFLLSVVAAPLVSAFVLGMASAAVLGSGDTFDAGVRSVRDSGGSLVGACAVVYAVQLLAGFVFVAGSVILYLLNAEVLSTVDVAGRTPDAALEAVLTGAFLFVLFALVLFLVALFVGLLSSSSTSPSSSGANRRSRRSAPPGGSSGPTR